MQFALENFLVAEVPLERPAFVLLEDVDTLGAEGAVTLLHHVSEASRSAIEERRQLGVGGSPVTTPPRVIVTAAAGGFQRISDQLLDTSESEGEPYRDHLAGRAGALARAVLTRRIEETIRVRVAGPRHQAPSPRLTRRAPILPGPLPPPQVVYPSQGLALAARRLGASAASGIGNVITVTAQDFRETATNRDRNDGAPLPPGTVRRRTLLTVGGFVLTYFALDMMSSGGLSATAHAADIGTATGPALRALPSVMPPVIVGARPAQFPGNRFIRGSDRGDTPLALRADVIADACRNAGWDGWDQGSDFFKAVSIAFAECLSQTDSQGESPDGRGWGMGLFRISEGAANEHGWSPEDLVINPRFNATCAMTLHAEYRGFGYWQRSFFDRTGATPIPWGPRAPCRQGFPLNAAEFTLGRAIAARERVVGG